MLQVVLIQLMQECLMGQGDFVWQQHTFNDHNGPFIECDVVVNELMADNVSAVQDPDDEYDDWVELYNNSSQPFDLSGFIFLIR